MIPQVSHNSRVNLVRVGKTTVLNAVLVSTSSSIHSHLVTSSPPSSLSRAPFSHSRSRPCASGAPRSPPSSCQCASPAWPGALEAPHPSTCTASSCQPRWHLCVFSSLHGLLSVITDGWHALALGSYSCWQIVRLG